MPFNPPTQQALGALAQPTEGVEPLRAPTPEELPESQLRAQSFIQKLTSNPDAMRFLGTLGAHLSAGQPLGHAYIAATNQQAATQELRRTAGREAAQDQRANRGLDIQQQGADTAARRVEQEGRLGSERNQIQWEQLEQAARQADRTYAAQMAHWEATASAAQRDALIKHAKNIMEGLPPGNTFAQAMDNHRYAMWQAARELGFPVQGAAPPIPGSGTPPPKEGGGEFAPISEQEFQQGENKRALETAAQQRQSVAITTAEKTLQEVTPYVRAPRSLNHQQRREFLQRLDQLRRNTDLPTALRRRAQAAWVHIRRGE